MAWTDALTVSVSSGVFVIIVDNEANERKLQHEFTHYVQIITGKMTDSIDGLSEEVKAHFSISDEYERYIFNRHEFWANIYNELFNDMQKNYWLHHKQLSWEEYVDMVALELERSSLDYRRLFLGHEWMSDGCSPLFLDTLACIAYVKPDFFDEIIEALKNKKDD